MEQTPIVQTLQSEPPVPHSLLDIGTRYEHLRELSNTLECGMEIFVNRAKQNRDMLSIPDKEKYVKLCMTYEIVNTLIDSMSSYKNDAQQYRMSRTIDQIPAAKIMEGYISA
jgi:hypothetical protein